MEVNSRPEIYESYLRLSQSDELPTHHKVPSRKGCGSRLRRVHERKETARFWCKDYEQKGLSHPSYLRLCSGSTCLFLNMYRFKLLTVRLRKYRDLLDESIVLFNNVIQVFRLPN